MRSSANDIPLWLASLSDKTLQRLNSRLTHLLRMIDVELDRRKVSQSTTNTESLKKTISQKSPPTNPMNFETNVRNGDPVASSDPLYIAISADPHNGTAEP